ncbi:MAG: carbohydrate-binding protein [bacterium]
MNVTRQVVRLLFVCSMALMVPVSVYSWEPNAKDLDAAVAAGDFGQYQASLSTWLTGKVPAEASKISEDSMKTLLKDPVLLGALAQRTFIAKAGVENIGKFAKADKDSAAFLAWILKDTKVMELYLEGATPLTLGGRDGNGWGLSTGSLAIWKKIYLSDPDSRQGIYLRLAMATALRPPGSGNRGAGMQEKPSDPLVRYNHFKTAHKNNELFPSFNNLTVWDYQHVVSSCASEGDLAWAREMINSWRPDLRIKEQVVNSTSEVWRRNSPWSFTNGFKSVLEGGGKCGPRSSWGVFIGQAFGIPSLGVGQPAHACIAARAEYPETDPQPGHPWKVYQGRGWNVSRLDGTSGNEFLAGVEDRYRAVQFTQVEHLRWMAAAQESKDAAAAIMAVAMNIRKNAETAEKPAPGGNELAQSTPVPEAPFKVEAGTIHIEAESFAKMSGIAVVDCYTGGKQVNFFKSAESSWLDYSVDVPAAGTYAATMRVAVVNRDQVLDIMSGAEKLATATIPQTFGSWTTTEPVEVKLAKGSQTIRISAPFQRGVALRWLELKAK